MNALGGLVLVAAPLMHYGSSQMATDKMGLRT
jgi:hypothetical protein